MIAQKLTEPQPPEMGVAQQQLSALGYGPNDEIYFRAIDSLATVFGGLQ
jgi:hypothetical protein